MGFHGNTGSILTASVDHKSAEPVRTSERVHSLDVLRGFALLGILLANIEDFASATGILHDIPLDVVNGVGSHHTLNMIVMLAQWLFVEGKMRSLFGLLLGAGTVLLLDRLERRSGAGEAADIFHRRYMWLILFGLIHGALIWYGDILFQYGILALLALYPLRNVKASRLMMAGFTIAILGGTLGIGTAFDFHGALHLAALQEQANSAVAHHETPTPDERGALNEARAQRQEELEAVPEQTAVERAGYLESEPDNARQFKEFNELVFSSGWVFEVIGIMVAGMGVYKTGFLSARFPASVYATVALAGYTVTGVIVLTGFYRSRLCGFSDAATIKWLFIPYCFEQVPGMLANASVILLLIRLQMLMPVQQALAAVGRTAASNYLFTSLICQILFKWGPWKLYGQLDYYQDLYVVAGVWTVNIVASMLWIRFFSFGPVEWLWRSLTYWKPQPGLARA